MTLRFVEVFADSSVRKEGLVLKNAFERALNSQKVVARIRVPLWSVLALLAACTSIQEVRAPQLPVEPAPILDLPHPQGYGSTELKSLFIGAKAPDRATLKDCGADFNKLVARTQAMDELRTGARELVLENPADYHWCFYDKFLVLEEELRKPLGIEERQKLTLEIFHWAVPFARAFQLEFKDSRYLRWAVQRYRALSPQIFFRAVELTPQATEELAVLENPFGIWKAPQQAASILSKYGLRTEPTRAPAQTKEDKSGSE